MSISLDSIICHDVTKPFPLPDECIDCVITSPPYWGLRDYGYEGQIGLESHPQEYIDKLVRICREVKRVLKKSGSFYLNLGDSYLGGKGKSGSEEPGEFTVRKKQGLMQGKASTYQGDRPSDICKQDGGWLKPKQLLGIPWKVANALQKGVWTGKSINSQEDACWFAGLIDSDGTIGIYKSHGYNGLRIRVMVTDKETIEHLCKITNIGKLYECPRKTVANKSIYDWKCQGKTASDLIHDIYPYLVCKKKQALVGWNFYLLQQQKDLEFEEGKEYGNEFGRPKMANSLKKKRIELADKAHKLNQKEYVNCNGLIEPEHPIKGGGWILRNAIIWHKPNPMPSSVKDRLNTTYEHVFHFVKNPRYYYDLDAIREPCKDSRIPRTTGSSSARLDHTELDPKDHSPENVTLTNRERSLMEFFNQRGSGGNPGHGIQGSSLGTTHPKGRNPGDFFEVCTQPFTSYNPDLEHFSVFPEELLLKPLKSSCPKQVCKKCGIPRERISKKIYEPAHQRGKNYTHREGTNSLTSSKACKEGGWNELPALRIKEIETLGWSDCGCNAGWTSGVVLDPFCGRGTTGKVAKKLGMHYILFDIKPEYCELARLYIGGQKYKVHKTQVKLDRFT